MANRVCRRGWIGYTGTGEIDSLDKFRGVARRFGQEDESIEIGDERERAAEAAVCDTIAYLYERYGAGLYGYALALLTDGADAEDVVQEVFAKFYARSRSGWRAEIPAHYLFRAVRNEAFSRLRRRRLFALWRERNTAVTPLLAPDDAYAGERERLDAALRALPVKQREIVVLKVFESMSFGAIASVLGISANTAASRYRYAVVKLRSLLDPEDFQR